VDTYKTLSNYFSVIY